VSAKVEGDHLPKMKLVIGKGRTLVCDFWVGAAFNYSQKNWDRRRKIN
jgi:hypothetical protein